MLCVQVAGGDFEADSQSRSPFAKNPGIEGATSDTPPDMRLKPPMRGEVDKNDRGRNKQYDSFLPSFKKPKNLQAERSGNRLSHGDLVRGKNPNW